MSSLAFWGSLALVLYVYLGYPLLVALIAAVLDRRVRRAPCEPTVSVLIAAHNEEQDIRQTLEDKLRLDYPKEKLEIVVVSDGSTDRTDEIARSFETKGVRYLRQEPRQGKTAALNLAVKEARGDILVFSDANSLYEKDALRKIVENFADRQVGYVTGKTQYGRPAAHSGVSGGCSAFMRYETFLRQAETRVGSLVGVNGGIDAVRRELYQPMRADQQPDFVLPLRVIEQGRRVVFDSRAILKETALAKGRDEYLMRVRVSLRALCAIWDMRRLLNPLRYGLYSWQLLSHKLLRYLMFVPLTMAYLSSIVLLQHGVVFRTACLLQTAIYLCALIGWLLDRNGRSSRFLLLPYYFSLINVASAHAVLRFFSGQRMATWNPRRA